MRRRKNRERRHTWLQRELKASGIGLNENSIRRPPLPPSVTQYETIAVRKTAPAKRHRPSVGEVSAFN
ncbi:MAG TPA: hypothetical protein VL283_00345 [Candidatus Baltobacteraceae bacterium]|nr:hypothetical protein [Candidatus Baltobacteraceae bacterium]